VVTAQGLNSAAAAACCAAAWLAAAESFIAFLVIKADATLPAKSQNDIVVP